MKYSLIEHEEGHCVFTNIIAAWKKQSWPHEQTQGSTAFLVLPAVAYGGKMLSCHSTLIYFITEK